MTTTTKQAWQLQLGDIIIPSTGAPPRRVLGRPRLQGSPPVALVEIAGLSGRTSYPAAQELTVEVDQ